MRQETPDGVTWRRDVPIRLCYRSYRNFPWMCDTCRENGYVDLVNSWSTGQSTPIKWNYMVCTVCTVRRVATHHQLDNLLPMHNHRKQDGHEMTGLPTEGVCVFLFFYFFITSTSTSTSITINIYIYCSSTTGWFPWTTKTAFPEISPSPRAWH